MEQRVECRCQILAKGIITIFFSQKYVIWKKFCTQLTCVGMGGGVYVISRTSSTSSWPKFRNALSIVLGHSNRFFIIMTNESRVQNWWVIGPTQDPDLPLFGKNGRTCLNVP